MTKVENVAIVDAETGRRNAISRLASNFCYTIPLASIRELTDRWPEEAILLVHDDGASLKGCLQMGRHNNQWSPIIAFSESPTADRVVAAMRMGVLNYLEWPFDADRLRGAIASVKTEASELVTKHASKLAAARKISGLSNREREVLDALSLGLSSKRIAEQLGISTRTVEIHRANVISKLKVANSISAVKLSYDASSMMNEFHDVDV